VENKPASGGGGAILPLPRDGGVEELYEDPRSGHAPRSGPEVKTNVSPYQHGSRLYPSGGPK